MPEHEHETLEGTVKILVDGKPRAVWKTSLAAKYVPALCRSWAAILRKMAPPSAVTAPGVEPMSDVWQRWLQDVAGVKCPLLPTPECPLHFKTGGGLRSFLSRSTFFTSALVQREGGREGEKNGGWWGRLIVCSTQNC